MQLVVLLLLVKIDVKNDQSLDGVTDELFVCPIGGGFSLHIRARCVESSSSDSRFCAFLLLFLLFKPFGLVMCGDCMNPIEEEEARFTRSLASR